MLVYAGPFPETSQSNTHVLLVTDYFTKWVEAASLQKKDPLSVAKALAVIFYRWASLLLVTSAVRWGALGCALQKYSMSTRWFRTRAGTLPSTGETMQCLSVALYKVLGKSPLSSCYWGKGERGRSGSLNSPKAKRAGTPLLCRSFKTIP